jgi:cytochrome c oxidase subunit 2
MRTLNSRNLGSSPDDERRPHPGLSRVRLLAVLGVGAVVLGGCQAPTFGAFRGSTVQGHDEFKLWVGMVITGLVVASLVWALIFWSIIRYRRRDETIPRQFHEHIPLEIIYTVLPFLIVLVIFYFTVITENNEDAISHPSEIVHVLAYQWGWKFTYANSSDVKQGVTIQTSAEPKLLAQPAISSQYPQLVLPEGVETEIVLTSHDVVHGFYIPAFNYSRYALPGVVNTLPLTPNAIGVYRGQCTQFCGLYHSEMLFSVRVESQANFERWLASEQIAQSSSGVGA